MYHGKKKMKLVVIKNIVLIRSTITILFAKPAIENYPVLLPLPGITSLHSIF